MDLISEVLGTIKLEGAVFRNAELTAPWSVSAPAAAAMAEALYPDARHLILYHLLLEGDCHVELPTGESLQMKGGEMLVVPHGAPHMMWNGNRHSNVDRELQTAAPFGPQLIRAGGGGARSRFICGYLACDPHLCGVVLAGLPGMFKVDLRSETTGQWLENTLRLFVEGMETESAGRSAVIAKFSDALFTETLRRFLAEYPPELSGWMAGARHPQVGKALAHLHREPRRAWTIGELAQQVGVSRSLLAERFTHFLGEPPMTYLTRWRLQMGARRLASSSASVAEIADSVGYESEPAFNRAFKRTFGTPPARFRRESAARASA